MWRVKPLALGSFPSLMSRVGLCRHASAAAAAGKGKQRTMAIRREDYGSQWERRAPLNPLHVKSLVDQGVKVLVQPSNRRAYPMQEYERCGAIIQEDISEASLIMGVKQVPIPRLIPSKTYCFFSHTIKAQTENMPMLDQLIERNVRLLDYEKIVDENGKRLVAFGKFAGIAGMINILHGIGLRLLALGHHTPFIHIAAAHNYRSSSMARQAIRDAGYEISLGLMPKSVGPMTFVFMGSGNVSQGAKEMIDELPVEYVEPQDLKEVAQHGDTRKIYATVVNRKDHLVRKDGGEFEAAEYDDYPERYKSVFNEEIGPWASCIINGIFWDTKHPRFLTNMDTQTLLGPMHVQPTSEPGCPTLPHRLLAICDITADPGGSIEFITDCTTIESPFCLYDADHRHQHFKSLRFSGDGVLVCSIDNMPAQLPREATDFFGGLLYPLVPELLTSDATKPIEEENFSRVVNDAIICSNGKLTQGYQYIQALRDKIDPRIPIDMATAEKKVLVLGSGMMVPPVIDYLTRDNSLACTIASDTKEVAEGLASRYPNTGALYLNVDMHPELLSKCIKEHDLVMSMLPLHLHSRIAKMCVEHKRHLATTSYTSPELRALQQNAVDAGITIITECGLDPGIDHMLAMECFENVKQLGGKVKLFESWCGGLPAPEFSANPLKYKFSWSPATALLAMTRDAKYLKDQQEIYLPPGMHMDASNVNSFNFLPGFNLEGYCNRDAMQYVFLYGIPTADNIIRGTLRYKGYCHVVTGLRMIGIADENPHPALDEDAPEITWRELLCVTMGASMGKEFTEEEAINMVFEAVGRDQQRLQAVRDLGLLSDTVVTKQGSPLMTLSHHLSQKLSYGEGERDLVIMRNVIGVDWPDGTQTHEEIGLTVYGEPNGLSAMAMTVGYPVAIAAKMVLEGEIQTKGIVLPLSKDVYKPILNRLKAEGIRASTRSIKV
ncbi:alpha-aminoadipic semialdehyde synthase, mitochondrial [Strongylocentrotus purpuratus]|uniref:Saccharopine dehydrogenase (NAD(+), L-glutamate-forming) n=1 Tax=Strongylocentrotus purpuratus TaxID=7668 RepID=A0A7M7PSR3_STRPU|nr:alpha-aminoadipic semialdehyde synthase, mitochondrial [Strongylocentrotus purpuratus]XP_030856177.1 alpha-aminoadipic semialdehyde synthase, mitochondrial [Strongylocentrotus purpuratus]